MVFHLPILQGFHNRSLFVSSPAFGIVQHTKTRERVSRAMRCLEAKVFIITYTDVSWENSRASIQIMSSRLLMLKKCGSFIWPLYREIILTLTLCTDVGGGSVVNGTRNSLARIPLRWMIWRCFIANTGIMFHKAAFPKVGLDPDTLYPQVLQRQGNDLPGP